MSVVSIATLYSYFNTGDKPTEGQFKDLIDTLSSGTNYSTTTDIIAYAGGGQTNATQLTTEYNKVTVITTNADSVKMPDATTGKRIFIVNADSAQSLAIFPKVGELFEGLSANTSVSLTFQASLEAFCFIDGTWTLL